MLVRCLELLPVLLYTVSPEIPYSLLLVQGAWVCEQSVVALDSWSGSDLPRFTTRRNQEIIASNSNVKSRMLRKSGRGGIRSSNFDTNSPLQDFKIQKSSAREHRVEQVSARLLSGGFEVRR